MNDLYDISFDRVHQPYRPIVAGRMSARQAQRVMTLLFAGGLTLLAAQSALGLASGIGLLGVIWIYNRYHKAVPATVFVMAAARLMVYVVTALAISDRIPSGVWIAALLQMAFVAALTAVARAEHGTANGRYSWPVVPWLIATMPMIDATVLAALLSPYWLFAGWLATAATRFGQKYVRGD